MLRRTFSIVTAAALLGVAGCGGGADSLVKDMISNMNAMADAMEKGDEAKIKEAQKKGEELTKKLDALKLSDEEKKKLLSDLT